MKNSKRKVIALSFVLASLLYVAESFAGCGGVTKSYRDRFCLFGGDMCTVTKAYDSSCKHIGTIKDRRLQ